MPGLRAMLGTVTPRLFYRQLPVALSGTHNGRAGFAGVGGCFNWLSNTHVRILSDDPVDLTGATHGGRQAGREPLGRGDEALQLLETATALTPPSG